MLIFSHDNKTYVHTVCSFHCKRTVDMITFHITTHFEFYSILHVSRNKLEWEWEIYVKESLAEILLPFYYWLCMYVYLLVK